MARCDEGYPCAVCGRDVEAVIDSDLYLRYILGEVPLESLHLYPERHIRCHPELAQFIVHPEFEPVRCVGDFDKSHMRVDDGAAECARVTRGWRRLRAVPHLGLALPEYPLSVTAFSEEETAG